MCIHGNSGATACRLCYLEETEQGQIWIITGQTLLFREWLHCRSAWARAHIFASAQSWGRYHTPCAATYHSTQPLALRLQHSGGTQCSSMSFPSATFPQVLAPVPFTLPPPQPSSPLKLDYFSVSLLPLHITSFSQTLPTKNMLLVCSYLARESHEISGWSSEGNKLSIRILAMVTNKFSITA